MTYTYKTASGKVIKTYSYKDLRKSTYSVDLNGMMSAETFIDAEDMSDYPVFTGYDEEGKLLPNGRYKVEITAKSALVHHRRSCKNVSANAISYSGMRSISPISQL